MNTSKKRLVMVGVVAVMIALAGCQAGTDGGGSEPEADTGDETQPSDTGTSEEPSDGDTSGSADASGDDESDGDTQEVDDPTGSLSEADLEMRKSEAQNASKRLKTTLTGRLQSAMQEGGPTQGMEVCTDDAIEIKHNISRETGWQVTRVSDNVRDPLLGTPDPWEQRSFEEMKRRVAEGESPANVSKVEVVQEPNGEYVRYMEPLPTKKVCTNCHGPRDEIDSEVKQILDEHYPHDEATGYELGELRGAVSIKIPVNGTDTPTEETQTETES